MVCFVHVPDANAQAENDLALRIVYAGDPGSSREKDFVAFLRTHFSKVDTTSLAKFGDSTASGYDVAIFDYSGQGFNPPQPKISASYDRPTVTVGVSGAFISAKQRLKTGYL